MRGRPGCPTGQEKNSVEATGGSPPFLFLQGKVGYWIAPSSDPASPAHLPPEGKALGVGAQRVENFLSQKCFPAYFFRKNASQIGFSIPDEIAPRPHQRQRSPKRANESERAIKTRVQGGALVFFPPTFFKESRAPPRSSAGNPRCRVHPATVPAEPPTDDRGSRPMGGFTPPPGSTAPG